MQTNSLRLLKLINNLLDLAKVDAGKMELYYNRADFAKYVNEVVFSVSPMAEKSRWSFNFPARKRFLNSSLMPIKLRRSFSTSYLMR